MVSIEGNKILSFYQDAKKLIKGEMVTPRFVSMWLTTSCDLHCSYCYFNDKNKEKKFADTSKVKKFIDEISSLGVESLELSGGGEPTLHPDCFNIIDYAHKKGLKVGLLTNGCKFDFNKMMNLSYVRFGIDSITAKQFNHIKGGKDNRFDILLYSIKKLLSVRKDNEFPYIGMKFMINQQNYTCIDGMVSLSFSIGVDYCHFKGTHSDRYKLTDLQILGVNASIAKKKETFPNFVFGNVSKCIATTKCFMAPIHAVITPNGNILSCCYFYSKDNIIGNAFDTNFYDSWFSDKHRTILNNIPILDCAKVDCRFSYYNSEMKSVVENGKYNISFI